MLMLYHVPTGIYMNIMRQVSSVIFFSLLFVLPQMRVVQGVSAFNKGGKKMMFLPYQS